MRKTHNRVGFGAPPWTTRFRKGVSGNPRGRPKGTRNLKTDLESELQQRVAVTEGGRRQRLSKQQALLKALYAKAVNGDMRATATLLNLVMKIIDPAEIPAGAETMSENDRQIIDNFLARHARVSDQKKE